MTIYTCPQVLPSSWGGLLLNGVHFLLLQKQPWGQGLMATMLHLVLQAAGNIFRYMVLRAFWDTFVIKETLVHFRIHKDFIGEINIPLRFTAGCVVPHCVGCGWLTLIPLPPLSPPSFIFHLQLTITNLVDVIQYSLLSVSYLQILQEVWS